MKCVCTGSELASPNVVATELRLYVSGDARMPTPAVTYKAAHALAPVFLLAE
jgi:hypothetical protein